MTIVNAMRNLLFGLLLAFAAVGAQADEGLEASAVAGADQAACAELKAEGASEEQLAKSGCCSWHDGVCGCSGTRVKCCDGTLSPSCTCSKPDTPGPEA